MGCPRHPSAATGAHPSKPNEKRCAKCGTLVAGPASAPRNLPNGSGCLILLVGPALLVAIGVVGARAAYAADGEPVDLSWIDGRHLLGVVLVVVALAVWFTIRGAKWHKRRTAAGDQLARSHHAKPVEVEPVRLRTDGGSPIVEVAPDHIAISVQLIREAREGSRWFECIDQPDGGTVITFGTAGRGEGRVAYRVDGPANPQADEWHAHRIA